MHQSESLPEGELVFKDGLSLQTSILSHKQVAVVVLQWDLVDIVHFAA